MNDYNALADIALAGGELNDAQCRAALDAPDADLLDLLAAAYRVRRRFWGRRVQIHVLTNAKSGLCPEDCHYCSQSAISTAPIERYNLMSTEQLLAEARRAAAARSRRYCIVLSGRGPSDAEVEGVCRAVRAIKAELDVDICCSVGLLEPDQARRFKEAGVDRVNHNLNTSERHHESICTTHTFQDRMRTLRVCREAGLELCSGAIFGQGEADDDIIDVTREFRRVGMESIPINFLIPIAGTPFGERDTGLNPRRCLKILALVRFLNPDREIRVAGGREVHLRSLQPLALYAANSIFVTGYLTEPGQDAPEAWRMIEDLGFEIELPPVESRALPT
jgi:biotin synthase